MWGEITYPFTDYIDASVEIGEWKVISLHSFRACGYLSIPDQG